MNKKAEEIKRKIGLASSGVNNYWYGKKGNLSPHWLDGKSFEPYCPKFNKEFKNLVRLRDNFCCLNCGMSEQKQIVLINKKLAVHHIDYNKKNTCLSNCCTLCVSCNTMANKNRNEWTDYYQEKLTNLYNYQYENQEEKFHAPNQV